MRSGGFIKQISRTARLQAPSATHTRTPAKGRRTHWLMLFIRMAIRWIKTSYDSASFLFNTCCSTTISFTCMQTCIRHSG